MRAVLSTVILRLMSHHVPMQVKAVNGMLAHRRSTENLKAGMVAGCADLTTTQSGCWPAEGVAAVTYPATAYAHRCRRIDRAVASFCDAVRARVTPR